MTDALINVPTDGAGIWSARCAARCEQYGYHLRGVVVGMGLDQWDEIRNLSIIRHEIEVVMVPSTSMLPPDRWGRVESLTQDIPRLAIGTAPTSRRHRRTQLIRRDAGA